MSTVARLQGDEWTRYRDIRLRSLSDAPDAFWMTHAEEAAFGEERWRERLLTGANFVAREGASDLGLATGADFEGREGCAGLFGMWVAPEARGSGVADRLVSAVIEWAREAGYQRLLLDVGDDNAPAIRLYERMGFRPTGGAGRMPPPRQHILEHERMLVL